MTDHSIIAKSTLRKKMKALRDKLPPDYRTHQAMACHKRLLKMPAYQNASMVYTYISIRSELSTISLIERMLGDGKRVACPRIQGKDMEFFEISSLDDCRPGMWGIPEPCASSQAAGELRQSHKIQNPIHEPGLMLLPGLAFDRSGNRLGYGGGYYDRYISEYPGHICIGLAYPEQIIGRVPTEKTDQPLHFIITGDDLLVPNRFTIQK